MRLHNARLVNVFSSEIYPAIIIVQGEIIAAVDDDLVSDGELLDCDGGFVLPGLIDGHIHVESSMLAPPEFAQAVLPHGTTTTVSDPHEIANVLGVAGVDYMLRASDHIPLNIFYMAPSCVPATHMETSGAALTAEDLAELLTRERVLGVAEMMNFPGVFLGVPEVLAKVEVGLRCGRLVDGHAPALRGANLQKYVAAGIASDHECFTLEEAREKLRLGLHLLIREGSAARNLEALLPLVNAGNASRFSFVCDDHYPDALLREGHVNDVLRRAVRMGLDPIRAVQMATLNTATYFGLRHPRTHRRLGGVAPGWHADLVVVDDLHDFHVRHVVKDGQVVVRDGRLVSEIASYDDPSVRCTFHVKPFEAAAFRILATGSRVRVIGVIRNQIVTDHLVVEPKLESGNVVADTERDLLKIASVERHRATGNIGVGLIQGFGLRRGALAISVGHDSHNITVVGFSDTDMKAAVEAVIALDGGCVAVCDGTVLASLALPVAGLMARQPLSEVVGALDRLNAVAASLGCELPSPFITLSFMPLAVIPKLKITDLGLVDVEQFAIVGLFVE